MGEVVLSSLTSILSSEKPLHVNSYASLARPTHSYAGFKRDQESGYLTFSALQWEVGKGKGYPQWLSMSQDFYSHFTDKENKAERALVMCA